MRVLPLRPDKALNVDKEGFKQWVTALAEETEQPITTYAQFIEALGQRVDYFHQHGCRVSDHALDTLRYAEADEEQLEAIFQKALAGKPLEKSGYRCLSYRNTKPTIPILSFLQMDDATAYPCLSEL